MPDFADWGSGGGGGGSGYLSLTGPGQTATPGELDQAGPFTVASGGAAFQVDKTSGGLAHSVVVSSPGFFNVGALGILESANQWSLNTSPGGIKFDTTASVLVNTGSFVANNSATVAYGITGAGAGSTPGLSIQNKGVSTTVGLQVLNGNPAGVIIPGAGQNQFCFDTATPAIWFWKAGSGAWVAI